MDAQRLPGEYRPVGLPFEIPQGGETAQVRGIVSVEEIEIVAGRTASDHISRYGEVDTSDGTLMPQTLSDELVAVLCTK